MAAFEKFGLDMPPFFFNSVRLDKISTGDCDTPGFIECLINICICHDIAMLYDAGIAINSNTNEHHELLRGKCYVMKHILNGCRFIMSESRVEEFGILCFVLVLIKVEDSVDRLVPLSG